jgi:anion-transporting  ArsA/GET3 family ATPase
MEGMREIESILARRAVLVTGKGGVGKTAVAAGLAHIAAASGKRTLVGEISYEPDATSPLARALGVEKTTTHPMPIAKNLRAMLLTPTDGHVRFLRHALHVGMLADAAMRSAAIRRFLLAAPMLPEMGILYRILDLVREKRSDGSPEHEVIIVDLPATGHTLGLAQIPKAILGVIRSGPIATAVREGLELLEDPKRTTTVVVTLPEALPVSEAVELVRGLRSHAIPLSGVVLNRMPGDPFEPAERHAVDAIVSHNGPLLGARTLPRIDRAKAALSRVKSEIGTVIACIGELAEQGALAPQIATALEGTR